MTKPSLPVTGRFTAKDQRKWDQTNKMIGRGSARSSTQRYALALGGLANSGVYSAGDVVFVSAEGHRAGRVTPDFAELSRAARAGVMFITDPLECGEPGTRSSAFNVGEREVAAFLTRQGYADGGTGRWTRRTR